MKLSVVIPSYKRPQDLDRCLGGLVEQVRKADQVIIILRMQDEQSAEVVARWSSQLPVSIQWIDRPGVIQALNLGLEAATGEIITITDDDSHAFPDWLARIEEHFEADPRLGGLGGRDIILQDGIFLPPSERTVGVILPYGRVIGNHHLGLGPAREVHFLKGVNMSWRTEAIDGQRFDEDFRGKGAQVSFELAFSLYILSRGWRLVYDPEVKVHHFPSLRFGAEQRVRPSVEVCEDLSFNFYVALLRYLQPGLKRQAALLWARTIGIANTPGWARGIMSWLKKDALGLSLRKAAIRAWDAADELVSKRPAALSSSPKTHTPANG